MTQDEYINQHRIEVCKTANLIKSGYAGVQSGTGIIVDRREHPDAIPIQENKMMGAPKPKPCQKQAIADFPASDEGTE